MDYILDYFYLQMTDMKFSFLVYHRHSNTYFIAHTQVPYTICYYKL